jgi:hypothetical protein
MRGLSIGSRVTFDLEVVLRALVFAINPKMTRPESLGTSGDAAELGGPAI